MNPCCGSFYGIYRACRDSAWRCQLEFDVCRLPVKVIGISRLAGIKVVRDSDVRELRRGELAVSIYDGLSWTVIYDDSLDRCSVRFVTAHELGHIFLGHDYRIGERRFAFSGRKISLEREADMFAVRLLAPAFVLHELRAFTPEKIAELCQIPLDQARERAYRMGILEARGAFYRSPMERELLGKFRPYLEEKGWKD